MPHITFVHGMSNKPPSDHLLDMWRKALSGGGLDLSAHGVTSSMVYWADVIYEQPEEEQSTESSGTDESAAIEAQSSSELRKTVTSFEKEPALESLSRRLTGERAQTGGSEHRPSSLERVPLPSFLKKSLMSILLGELTSYFANMEHTPRPGVRFRVRDEIRNRTTLTLSEAARASGPHVVVAHGNGAVIAYDCFVNVLGCPMVDHLVTLGCPLGFEEIQRLIRPHWSPESSFPSGGVRSRWVNVFDRLDPIVGSQPSLREAFLRQGLPAVEDIEEPNWGSWRNTSSKYLSGRRFQATLRQLLEQTD